MDASSPKDVKAAQKREKRTRIQELNDISYILSTSKGRRFYWRLMEFCELNRLSYTRGDTHETAFREGMRNVGNKLLVDLMDADGNLYNTMREENIEEAENAGTDSGSGTEDGSEAD